MSPPTEPPRRLPRWSMWSTSPLPSRRSTSARATTMMSSRRSVDGVLGVEVEAHVHLDAPDCRKVVALGSKNSEWNIASPVSSVGGSPGRITR